MSDLKDKRPLAKARVQVVAQTKSRLLPATVWCKPVLQESPAIKHNAVPPAPRAKKKFCQLQRREFRSQAVQKAAHHCLGHWRKAKDFCRQQQQFAKVAWTCWTGRTVKRVAIARESQPTRPRLSLVFPMISPSQIKTFPHGLTWLSRNKGTSKSRFANSRASWSLPSLPSFTLRVLNGPPIYSYALVFQVQLSAAEARHHASG